MSVLVMVHIARSESNSEILCPAIDRVFAILVDSQGRLVRG